MPPSETSDPIARRDALAGRLFEAALGLMGVGAIHIGDRLGPDRGLERLGPATPWQLADATGTDERWVREWLQRPAVSGLLAPLRHRGRLPDLRRAPGRERALALLSAASVGAAREP